VSPPPGSGVARRRLLAGALLAVPALAGCSFGPGADEPPDPLIALADAARSDAALASAVVAAAPDLADKVRPLADARLAHAAALDAEVSRLDPERTVIPTPAPVPATGLAKDGLARVRSAAQAAATAAAAVVPTLETGRVGLVASVAACCSAYAAVLG
jgi:hypothetical protein